MVINPKLGVWVRGVRSQKVEVGSNGVMGIWVGIKKGVGKIKGLIKGTSGIVRFQRLALQAARDGIRGVGMQTVYAYRY